MFILPSCSKFDDSSIWDKLNEHGNRIAELETMQTILEALQKSDYIKSVVPVMDGSKEVDISPRFTTY